MMGWIGIGFVVAMALTSGVAYSCGWRDAMDDVRRRREGEAGNA